MPYCKTFFKRSGQRVKPQQHGAVRIIIFALVNQFVNGFDDIVRFKTFRCRAETYDLVAVAVFGEQFFVEPLNIAFDNFIGDFQNIGRGTVVLFQLVQSAFKVVLKRENVFNVRAAPCVDALILVADCKDISVLARKNFCNIVLNDVSILKLVDMYVIETCPR